MKPTPTDTRCPPLNELRRLLQPGLPEAEAGLLRDHFRTCLACRQLWQQLQTETVASPTPPLLHPPGDTNSGRPALPSADFAIDFASSEVVMVGPGGHRQPNAPLPPPGSPRPFPFLSPPREGGELGWLGVYRITRVLGEGGMGYVFDAFDTHLHRQVALKVLKPDLAANGSFRERFLQEARAAAALPDEFIITIYHVGVENDVPFLAMKFLHGESLEQRLQQDGPPSCMEILRIGREIALGLSAAHDRGLIHRDIKPANLWLETPPPDQGGSSGQRLSCEFLYRIKILDFGLARPVNDSRRLTATGLIVGTPQYLAPEQARGQPLDHRCDLFSLGIVLYRLATGILPFDGADTLAQLTALAIAEPRPLEDLSPNLPAGLRQLIHQLLARDPADRPPTARAVAETLRALEKDETLPISVGRAGKPAPNAAGRTVQLDPRKMRRRWVLASGLLCLLLAGGMLFWNGFRSTDDEEEDADPAGKPIAAAVPSGEPIKVGILFSLRGTMASGGTAAHDVAQLAIDELNEQGGLLGRPLVAIHEDGESDYRKFTVAAEKLIKDDRVKVIFGTRTSSNRKAVKDVVEKHNNLLFYPMQFEGLEDSPNVVYLGAVPNQQIQPTIDYMVGKLGKRRLFLVGSDYVFPHSANAILRDYVEKKYPDIHILGEKYIPLGSPEVHETIQAIQKTKPDLILNTINGDTNSAFFRALFRAGIRANTTTILSFSMTENDLIGIGEEAFGHYASWSYFQSVDRPENREFVGKFQKRFTSRRVISDPMETLYFGVHLWAQAVQAAGSVEPRAVRNALKGREMEAPEGRVRIERDALYAWRVMRIGRVRSDGQFEIVFDTEWAIQPKPFPDTRSPAKWEQFLKDLYTGWGNRWQASGKE